MKMDNVLFAVAGLLLGAIVGFMFANSVNRNAMQPVAAQVGNSNSASGNPALPADHPPIGAGGGDPASGGMQPQVQQALDKAKNEPQNFDAQVEAASMYAQIGQSEKALPFLEAAAKLNPTDTTSQIDLGNAFFDSNKFEDAEKWYTKALEKDPKNVNVRTDLGLTFYLRTPKQIDRAIEEYKKSLAINPDHEITLQNLALAYDETGKKDELAKTIEQLKKVNPDNPAVKKYEGKN